MIITIDNDVWVYGKSKDNEYTIHHVKNGQELIDSDDWDPMNFRLLLIEKSKNILIKRILLRVNQGIADKEELISIRILLENYPEYVV